MARISKAELKAKFAAGRKPTEADFADLIDSLIHLDDQTAVDAQIINTKIATYDTGLKSQIPNGTVDSVGDVFAVFQGYDDNRKVHNELSWSGLPGKPTNVALTWNEQVVVPNSNGAYQGEFTDLYLGSAAIPGISAGYLVIDLRVTRTAIPGGPIGSYADKITAIKLAVAPSAKLN